MKNHHDPDKDYVDTGKHGQINSISIPDLQYTTFGKLLIYRLKKNRDMKILITGKGKTTGTGKTTLAILIAKWINEVRNHLFEQETEWKASEYSFMDVWEYLQQYEKAQKGDAFVTDELEYMADRRRHMSDQNLYFSQAWSVLRYKNAVTIGTAPGLSDLEKRIIETADIWINVVERGKANTYYLTFDDFEWKPIFKRLRMGNYKESIVWDAIDNDPDYQWLSNQKQELGVPGLSDKKNQIDETDMNELEKNIKNDAVRESLRKFSEENLLYPDGPLSQGDIADIIGVSQQQVSKLKREMEKEGIIPA